MNICELVAESERVPLCVHLCECGVRVSTVVAVEAYFLWGHDIRRREEIKWAVVCLLCAWRVWERAGDAETNKKRETHRAAFRAAVCKCVIKVSNKRVRGRERKNVGPH